MKNIFKKLNNLHHPNIVKHYWPREVHVNGKKQLAIIMDLVKGNSLDDYLSLPNTEISKEQLLKYIKQLLDVLNVCHKNNIFHNDLHLGNIMIDQDDNVIVIDFSFADVSDQPDICRKEDLAHFHDILKQLIYNYQRNKDFDPDFVDKIFKFSKFTDNSTAAELLDKLEKMFI